MCSYAIDSLFDSEYYIGDTEEIETTEALQAPDSEHFITVIKKEVHSLISETMILQPITSRTAITNGHGKFTQPSSAIGKRSRTENQTSTRPGQQQEATIYGG